jgi:hypothetical protein
MIISFFKKFDLVIFFARGEQLLKASDDFRFIHLRLFEESAGHAEGNFEVGIFLDEPGEHNCGGQIAFVRNLFEYLFVHFVPDELFPRWMQPKGLMQLKIKCRYRHLNPCLENIRYLGPAYNSLRTRPDLTHHTDYNDCNLNSQKTQ